MKIEIEVRLRLLKKELIGLNGRNLSAKEYYHRQSIVSEIDTLEREISPPKLDQYPTMTMNSPRGKTREFVGKVVNMGGKRKIVTQEPKQYQPLKSEVGKSDTLSGYGEKRKRYVR